MTVTALHPTRVITVPALSRARRRTELERMVEDATIGVPPSATAMSVLLSAYASERLSGTEADAKWGDLISEARRLQAVEAGEPEWADLQPGLAEADYAAALNDLIDGTDSYRGTR